MLLIFIKDNRKTKDKMLWGLLIELLTVRDNKNGTRNI